MARRTDTTDVRIAKEGPMPGYSDHIPGVTCHVMGRSYSDASRSGVAITESLLKGEFRSAIHLVRMGCWRYSHVMCRDACKLLLTWVRCLTVRWWSKSTDNRAGGGGTGFHAELSRSREKTDPTALLWRCSLREAPPETRGSSGKVDLESLRSVSASLEKSFTRKVIHRLLFWIQTPPSSLRRPVRLHI